MLSKDFGSQASLGFSLADDCLPNPHDINDIRRAVGNLENQKHAEDIKNRYNDNKGC